MMIIKICCLLSLNIIALIILVIKKIKAGSSIREALVVVWEKIILNNNFLKSDSQGTNLSCSIEGRVIHQSWWIAFYLILFLWIIGDSKELTIILITLVTLHIIWYFFSKKRNKKLNNQIINLNSNWGIIFQIISENSIFKDKSLADLDLRKKNLLVLAIEHEGQTVTFPKGMEKISSGDKVVIFGDLNYYRGMIE